MPRDTRRDAGSWLEGPTFQRGEPRGARLGLPAEGPGSLASPGARIAAFVIDAIVANLLAGVPYLFGVTYATGVRGYVVYGAFLLQEFLLDSVAGGTIGKQVCGIRVVRLDGGRLAWPWVLVRTILLGILVPAVIWDRDGRGLHDRAAGALTVRVAGRTVADRVSGSGRVAGRSETKGAARPPTADRPQTAATPPEIRSRTGATAKPPVRRRKKRR